MKQETILKKAIEKAVKNGWNNGSLIDWSITWEQRVNPDERVYYAFIFSHSFAKAFWGEENMCIVCERTHQFLHDCDAGNIGRDPEWVIRLRQMVLEKDPIQYLKKFL